MLNVLVCTNSFLSFHCVRVILSYANSCRKNHKRHKDKGRAKTSLKNISLTLFVTFACERETAIY